MSYVIVLLLLIAPSFAPKIAVVQESAPQSTSQAQQQQPEKSKQPTPSTRKSKSNPPSKKPTENTQVPNPNATPPEQPSPKPQAPQGETTPTNTSQKPENKTSPDWWIVYLTGALVFVGVCQLIAMGVQTYWMIRTVKVATESTAVAQETAERQLRAYILPTTAQRYRATAEQPSQVKIKVKNFGVTPAYECTNWMAVDVLPWPLPSKIVLTRPPDPEQHRSMYYLGAGDQIELGGEWVREPTAAQEEQIRHGEYAIVAYGEINYRDVFHIRRVTKFRFFCIGELIRTGLFSPHDEGNEAD